MSSDGHDPTADEPVLYEFRLPDPGEGLTEAELLEWHVAPGDEISEDDPLCEVETDKAVVEIPAPCDGTVEELRAEPGETMAVGDVIAVFETSTPPNQANVVSTAADDQAESATTGSAADGAASRADATSGVGGDVEPAVREVDSAEDGASSSTAQEKSASDGAADRVMAPPRTRRYAREEGVDIAQVEGTGPGGRVLQADVDRYRREQETPAAAETAAGATGAPEATAPAEEATAGDGDRVVRRPLRGLRKTIAENMTRSAREIPHVTSGFEADAEALVDLKERLDAKHEPRITYTAILVKAVVPALEAFPLVNASVNMEAEEIIEKRHYNVGVATHTDDGLLVPVVDDVDEKSLVEVARELTDLTERARDRSVSREELTGGTFTITNVGSHGGHGTFGTPIINHPEAAIMGVGQIKDDVVPVDDEETAVRKRLGLTLSYDHRLIDGVTAGQFVEHVIESVEDPDMFLARL